MNKKGFTLIEITAVVLILGVIFLMSYPTLENILKKSEKDQVNVDKENITMAAKTYINIHNDEYEFVEGNVFNISSSALFKEGLIDNANFNYVSCTYKNSNLVCDIAEYPLYNNGTAIYFDPETASLCTEEEANINVNSNGTPTGVNSGCMKWYIFNDEKENETVNMILNHNTTIKTYWNSTGSNAQMKEVKEALENDITSWDESVKTTARLITADEIAQITQNNTFNSKTSSTDEWFYLDSNSHTQVANSQNLSKYAWLYDYTYNCISYGCYVADSQTKGYWTSSIKFDTSNSAWSIGGNGDLGPASTIVTVSYNIYGIRPVISVDKTTIY